MFELSGGVAALTGAGSGIGRSLALLLGARNMTLALCDRDEAGLAETAQLVGTAGARVTTHVVDVGDKNAVDAWAANVVNAHGRVTLVVNNAGVGLYGSVLEISADEIAWLMNVNFWGVVHGTKAFLPALLAQPRGCLVNVSSVFGIWGAPGNAAYTASKFAVRGFTESLRGELAQTNVRVCTVHPGGIKTNIAKSTRIARAANPQIAQAMLAAFDARSLRMSPDDAAKIIVDGIVNERERIIVGSDARFIDRVVRLAPEAGASWLARRTMPRAASK